MFDRLKQAIDAGKTAVSEAEETSNISPPNAMAWLVLDEFGPDAARLHKLHVDAAAKSGVRPLFILGRYAEHEHSDLSLLIETLPLPEDLILATDARTDEIQSYILRRLLFIFRKWNVEICHYSGPRAAELRELAEMNPEPESQLPEFVALS